MKCRAWKNWRGYWKKFRFDGLTGKAGKPYDKAQDVFPAAVSDGRIVRAFRNGVKTGRGRLKLAVAQTVSRPLPTPHPEKPDKSNRPPNAASETSRALSVLYTADIFRSSSKAPWQVLMRLRCNQPRSTVLRIKAD